MSFSAPSSSGASSLPGSSSGASQSISTSPTATLTPKPAVPSPAASTNASPVSSSQAPPSVGSTASDTTALSSTNGNLQVSSSSPTSSTFSSGTDFSTGVQTSSSLSLSSSSSASTSNSLFISSSESSQSTFSSSALSTSLSSFSLSSGSSKALVTSSPGVTSPPAEIAATNFAGVTLTSDIVTTINGSLTTLVTTIPTTLNDVPNRLTSGQRAGVVIGSAVGGLGLIVAALAGAILYRRVKRRKLLMAHRQLPTPRRTRLEDEDAFDLGGPGEPVMTYPYLDDHPTLLRPRATDSGSIFHEGVWPPPGQILQDPIRAASNVDLNSVLDIMDDPIGDSTQMGPAEHVRGGLGSSGSGHSYTPVHTHEPSDSSQTGLLLNRTLVPSPVSDTRSVTFAESPRSAKAREASAARSRLSIATMPLDESTPLTRDEDSFADRRSTGSVYSAASLARGDLPPGAAAPTLGPRPLVDIEYEPTGGIREIPPLYHTIRRDTSSSIGVRTEHRSDDITDKDVGHAL